MKTLTLFAALLFSTLLETKACLNVYYSIDSKGHLHRADDLREPIYKDFNLRRIEKQLKKLEQQMRTTSDYKLLSDYAVLLLKSGKTEKSLEILKSLAQNYPDEYQLAANLGTAYELKGDNEMALKFIKKGMELNPNAHQGSEWVHVKVLETKIQLAKDSTYLNTNTVLGLTEDQKNSDTILKQILIQVRERIPFTKGPDPIMASILIDLADCYANTSSIEFAKVLYTISQKYYGANDSIIANKVKKMVQLRGKYSNVRPERKRYDDADHVKILGIRYQDILLSYSGSTHTINWKELELNTDTILAFADLKKYETLVAVPIEDTIQVDSTVVEPTQSKTEDGASTGYMTYYLIGGGVLMLILILLVRSRLK